jgi:hypothetical protein
LPLHRALRYRSSTVSILLHLNGNVGTDNSTGGAACTFPAVIKSGNIISFEIQIIGNNNRFFRTEFDAEGTALAAFPIYMNGAF